MKDHYSDEMLNAFVDGELTGPRKDEIGRHLGECAACSEKIRRLTEVIGLVKALPRLRASASFRGALVERLSRERVNPLDAAAAWAAEALFSLVRTPAFYMLLLFLLLGRFFLAPQPDSQGDFACLAKPSFVRALCQEGEYISFLMRL